MSSIKPLSVSVLLAVSAFFTLFLCYPTVRGELGFADDAQFIYFTTLLSEYDGSWFSFLVSELMQSEVGRFPDTTRFRPVYYFLNILGSTFFGYTPGYWFALNALMLYAGLIFFALALNRYFSWQIVILAIAVICAFRFHVDLWSRLGPSERYGFLFGMLFMYGLTKAHKNFWAWLVCCVSFMMALGVKENFLCLLLPLAISGWVRIRARQNVLGTLFTAALVLLYSTPFVIVLVSVLTRGSDVYLASRGFGGLFLVLLQYFGTVHFFIFLLCAIGLSLLYQYRQKLCLSLSVLNQSACCLAVLCILSLTNFLFYKGNIAPEARYAFPFHVFSLLAVLTFAYASQPLWEKYTHTRKKLACVALVVSIGVLGILTQIHSASRIQKSIDNTRVFKQHLNETFLYKNTYIINVDEVIETYEAYFSLKFFAKAGLSAPVRYFSVFGKNEDALQRHLEEDIRRASADEPPSTIDASTLLLDFYEGVSKKIEHGFTKMPAGALLTRPRMNKGKTPDGKSLRKTTTIFFPVENPHEAKEIRIRGSFDNFEVWQSKLNAIEVAPAILDGTLVIPISDEAKNSMPSHHQLFELELVCLQKKICSKKRLYITEAEVTQQ